MNIHINGVHRKLKPFGCQYCKKSFSVKWNLKTHVKRYHENNSNSHDPVILDITEFSNGNENQNGQGNEDAVSKIGKPKTKKDLRNFKKNFKCDECEASFFGKQGLNYHIEAVHIKSFFRCEYCKKSFKMAANLKRHIKSIHQKLKSHKCSECEKTFSQKLALQLHIKIVHLNMELFKCEYCDKTFSQKVALEQHEKIIHLNIKPFKCEYCQHSFGLKSDLKKHVNGVHEKIRHKCEYCDSSFSQKPQLKNHVSKMHPDGHQTDLINKCVECGKVFKSNSSLQLHVNMVHLKLKPFKCQYCEHTSGYKQALQKHIKNVHSNFTNKCVECGNMFSTKYTLQKHMNTVHMKLKPYKCQYCDYTSGKGNNVTLHENAVHLKIRYKCEHCESSYSQKCWLKNHVKKNHL